MSLIKKSKYLTLLLRHNPEKESLVMDKYGWVSRNKLIIALNISNDDLDEIVNYDEKSRFEFSKNKAKIRACQGHSVDILLGITPSKPPKHLYHGTSETNRMDIITEGISKMKRNHVHLSEDIDTAISVGSRHGSPSVLTVSSEEMYDDGIKFYFTTNEVWLTEHVPPRYIKLNL